MYTKQHTVQKTEPKTETVVNLVKPKPNRKLQFFCKTEPKTEPKSFFANRTPLVIAFVYKVSFQLAHLQAVQPTSRTSHGDKILKARDEFVGISGLSLTKEVIK